MAEQYFANKDKELTKPKAKKALKGEHKKMFVLPMKGQKEYEDVERLGRKVKRVVEVPMKSKDVLKTKAARVYSKAEKAMLLKSAKKLEGLIKKRTERSEARAIKPLTLEEQNIKTQLLEKLEKGIEATKSPEQKKIEKQMLLALEAPPAMMAIEASPAMMAIEEPKKGRPKGSFKPIPTYQGEFLTSVELYDKSLDELKELSKKMNISSKGNRNEIALRIYKKMEQAQKEKDEPKALVFQEEPKETSKQLKKEASKYGLVKQRQESNEKFKIRLDKKKQEEQSRPMKQKEIKAFFTPKSPKKSFKGSYYDILEQDDEEMPELQKPVKPSITEIGNIVGDILDVPELKQEQQPMSVDKMVFKNLTAINELRSADAIAEAKKYGFITTSGVKAKDELKKKFKKGELTGKGLKGELTGKGLKGELTGGGVTDFLKGLAHKAIEYVKKDPIGALKQAVSIGKQAYEHGTKAKEMYDKFFKKDKAKGGMLEGFTEPQKRQMVHHIYKLNVFNKAMEK